MIGFPAASFKHEFVSRALGGMAYATRRNGLCDQSHRPASAGGHRRSGDRLF